MKNLCFRMASPPYSSPPKHHYQLSLTKRLETTKRKPETSNRTLGTQLEESLETAGIWRSRDRSDTDPTQIRRSSDTPRGSSESENRSPSFSGRRRLRPDLSRKVSSREMGRNSLPGGVKLSFPATKKLTMMERMSRRRVLSDGDFSGDFLCLQVGTIGQCVRCTDVCVRWVISKRDVRDLEGKCVTSVIIENES